MEDNGRDSSSKKGAVLPLPCLPDPPLLSLSTLLSPERVPMSVSSRSGAPLSLQVDSKKDGHCSLEGTVSYLAQKLLAPGRTTRAEADSGAGRAASCPPGESGTVEQSRGYSHPPVLGHHKELGVESDTPECGRKPACQASTLWFCPLVFNILPIPDDIILPMQLCHH